MLAIVAARAGSELTAVTAITLVSPTSAAEIPGALPSCARTWLWTWALVTSCSSVSTSAVVSSFEFAPVVRLTLPTDCTSSCAVAAYCLVAVSDRARLIPSPRSETATTHQRPARRICR